MQWPSIGQSRGSSCLGFCVFRRRLNPICAQQLRLLENGLHRFLLKVRRVTIIAQNALHHDPKLHPGLGAALELAEELIVEVVAVRQHHQRRIVASFPWKRFGVLRLVLSQDSRGLILKD